MYYLEFITKYWSQILLLIGAVGWIIKTVCETYLRKREMKYNFFYSSKVDSIKNLLNMYHQYERFFSDCPYYKISKGEINAIGLDEMITPFKIKYFSAHNELILYFTGKELEKFKLIKHNLNIVHDALGKLLFKEISVSEYYNLMDVSRVANQKLLNEISGSFIKEFN